MGRDKRKREEVRRCKILTADQLDALSDEAAGIYLEFEQAVINDIARRISNMSYSSAGWQINRLQESGILYQDILKQVGQITGKSETELRKIFYKAGARSLKFDDSIYTKAGLEVKPLALSPQMMRVLEIGLQKTNGLLNNLTLTTAASGQQAFIRATDLAYLEITSGAMDYNSAIRKAIKSVGASGLEVLYPSGHRDKLDVAVRRATLTGVSQTAGNLQWARGDELGQDLVQVSAHGGARPLHALWQGKIYSRSGADPKYPHFATETGYGTGAGLGGWNCRHSYYPFFKGISENAYSEAMRGEMNDKTVMLNGKQVPIYEATQVQRGIERKIRAWKREAGALAATGKDNLFELSKVREWQGKARSFVKETGLQRQNVREQVIGGSKAVKSPEIKTVQPITPLTPAAPAPAGKPVSEALDTSGIKNKAMKQQVELALGELDKVHGDGELPKIPIKESSAKRKFGTFWAGRDAVKIDISKTGNHQALTLLHETGHFIDHSAFIRWSSQSRELNGLITAAARESKWYKDVWVRFKEANSALSKDYPPFTIGRKYVNYLTSSKELYARAYAQYIATKSGNSELLRQLKALQDAKFSSQWSDDDFLPILEAFDALFTSVGWIK